MSPSTRDFPRFNHVAMSVPAELLDEQGRADILGFYGDVFGWQELPTETVDRYRLVMMVHDYEQFVFLIADDPPMQCPKLDHFGLSVSSMDELDATLTRAEAFAANDDRVEIIEKKTVDHGALLLTSFYVRYLLPLMVEVQHFDYTPSREAARASRGA